VKFFPLLSCPRLLYYLHLTDIRYLIHRIVLATFFMWGWYTIINATGLYAVLLSIFCLPLLIYFILCVN
jgi:hypothetical protein